MPQRSHQLSASQISRFNEDGFLVLENFLDAKTVAQLANKVEPLFSGKFETGVFPDEWYWRPGANFPDMTREMGNVWKCDLTIASVVLSAEIGRISATLAGWRGARLGQDSLWWKPSGSKEVTLHQDSPYVSFLTPAEMLTCWIALDNTYADTGTIEYVRGSHKWNAPPELHQTRDSNPDYRSAMQAIADHLHIEPEIVKVEIPAGGCVFHHGLTWHGSGKNLRTDRIRRSLAVHSLSSDTCFQATDVGYIYGRYRRAGEITMDENFFPITWTRNGYRTPFLANYCQDAIGSSVSLAKPAKAQVLMQV